MEFLSQAYLCACDWLDLGEQILVANRDFQLTAWTPNIVAWGWKNGSVNDDNDDDDGDCQEQQV